MEHWKPTLTHVPVAIIDARKLIDRQSIPGILDLIKLVWKNALHYYRHIMCRPQHAGEKVVV